MTKARPNVQLAADQGLQEAAAQYVWNKVHGKPMRAIARATGVHASTVMRHVRKIENNAEDPKNSGVDPRRRGRANGYGTFCWGRDCAGEKIPAHHWRGVGGI